MAAVQLEDGVFDGGPPRKLEHQLRFKKAGRRDATRRAIAVVLIGWVPLVLLAWAQSLLGAPGIGAFLSDFGVQARSLLAAPLLVLAQALGAPRLSAIAEHFVDAGLVREQDRARFLAAVSSTRRLLDSTIAEAVVVLLAYAAVGAIFVSVPAQSFPAWAWADAAHGRTPAGYWHAIISMPLLLVFLIGWLWRLALWTRFLWLMARLDLALVPAHPDRAAGLSFVGHSLRAYAPVAFALAVIVAGSLADLIAKEGPSLHAAWFIVGVVLLALFLFGGPLLVLSGRLLGEWRRGTFSYGALAQHMGQSFEAKWLDGRGDRIDRRALESPDFSATTDLYQVAANVYGMRLVPLEPKHVVVLIIATLLPFAPLALMVMPLDEILSKAVGLLI